MRLAEQAGLHNLVDKALSLPGSTGSNPSGKAAAIIAGMLTRVENIDDCNLIRQGGMRSLFTGVYTPQRLSSGSGGTRWLRDAPGTAGVRLRVAGAGRGPGPGSRGRIHGEG